MNICIVAGGTLGHIMPGLILAKELSKKHKVIYITSLKDKRFDILTNCDYLKEIYYIEAEGLSKNLIKDVKPFIKDIKAIRKIKTILKEEQINLVIGMGGYISGIAILSANKKISKIIHEQNKIIGLGNKVVLSKVDKILLTYDIKLKNKWMNKAYIVSNPCLFTKKPNITKDKTNILITSGSNGAKEINDLATDIINRNLLSNYNITLITGKKYYEDVIKNVNKKPNVSIYPFVDNMSEYIYKASIIISRAGAATIFESLALETIPLLFPSLNVTNNHQYHNALEITREGMGEIIDKDNVLKKIHKVANNYNSYITNIKRYKKHYSLENVIDIIEEGLT